MTHLRIDIVLLTLIFAVMLAALIMVVGSRPRRIVEVLAFGLPAQTIALGLLTALQAGVLVTVAAAWKEAVLLMAIAVVLLTRRAATRLTFPDYGMMAYGLLVTAEALFPVGGSDINHLILGYRQAMVPVALYALGRLLPFNSTQIRRALTVVVVAASAVAAIALLDRILVLDDLWKNTGVITYIANAAHDPSASPETYFYSYALGGQTRRAIGPYASPLTLSYSLIFPASLVIAHLISGKFPLPRKLVWTAGTLIGLAIILSITRAVILGVVAAAILGPVLLGRASGLLRTGAVVCTVAVVLFTQISQVVGQTTSLSDPSSRNHSRALSEGAQVVRANPLLGTGLGQAGFVGETGARAGGTEGSQPIVGESFYLVLAAEQGIPALILFLFAVAGIILATRHTSRVDDPITILLKRSVMLAAIAFLVASVTTEHWSSFQSSALFWLFAGAAITAVVKTAPMREPQP